MCPERHLEVAEILGAYPRVSSLSAGLLLTSLHLLTPTNVRFKVQHEHQRFT